MIYYGSRSENKFLKSTSNYQHNNNIINMFKKSDPVSDPTRFCIHKATLRQKNGLNLILFKNYSDIFCCVLASTLHFKNRFFSIYLKNFLLSTEFLDKIVSSILLFEKKNQSSFKELIFCKNPPNRLFVNSF
jgi:hypothetical protein